MATGFINWLNERFPFSSMIKFTLDEDIPGGARFLYSLGSSTLFVFALQALTGVWQMFFYVPTTDHAYVSLSYLRISVPFGWLIHGIHYWGAQAMIVLVGLHLFRVFLWGAYKKPREVTWLAGVVLLLLTAAMSFTGVLLPWDETGYFAAQVGTSISSTFPYIGNWIKEFIIAGASMGQLTLSRFFIMHVAILPAILFMFIGIHLVAFRKHGSIGPWKITSKFRSGPFWPDQIFMDAVVGILVLMIIITLSVYNRAPFTGPADPLDTSFHPKPEWNFLFLYQALKAFKGNLEPIGTILLPLILVLFLFFIPFIDHSKERNPLKRPVILSLVVIFYVGIISLTIIGKNSVPLAGKISPSPTKIEAGVTMPADALQGHQLFTSNHCVACHSINGAGGTIGPDLSHEPAKGRSRQWLIDQVENPKLHFPTSVMPPFASLSQEQLNDLADYLLYVGGNDTTGMAGPQAKTFANTKTSSSTTETPASNPGTSSTTAPSINGLAASFIGNPKHGGILFRHTCEGCHGVDGKGQVPNPGSASGSVPALNPITSALFSKDALTFVDFIDPIIQHGSTPPGPDPALKMPDFGDANTMTQPQIAQVEAYILELNSVDRAQIQHPGIKPLIFLWFTVGLFLLTALSLLIYWILSVRGK